VSADVLSLDWMQFSRLSDADKKALTAWLGEHDVDLSVCFLIEVRGGTLTSHTYDRDDEGEKFLDDDGGVATAEPVEVECKSPCPIEKAPSSGVNAGDRVTVENQGIVESHLKRTA